MTLNLHKRIDNGSYNDVSKGITPEQYDQNLIDIENQVNDNKNNISVIQQSSTFFSADNEAEMTAEWNRRNALGGEDVPVDGKEEVFRAELNQFWKWDSTTTAKAVFSRDNLTEAEFIIKLDKKVNIDTGLNLLNPDEFTVGFVRADGTISTSSSFNYSARIKVEPSKRYAFSKTTGGVSYAENLSRSCFYDVDGNVITGGSDSAHNSFTTSATTFEVIVSFNSAFTSDNLQLEQNDTSFTQYQAYYEKIGIKASDLIEAVIEDDLSTSNAVKPKSYIDDGDTANSTYTDEQVNSLQEKVERIYTSFEVVEKPSAFNYTPPFTIYKNNRKFLPQLDFDLNIHSGIADTVTYYVDKENGSDSNDGLTLATAFQTLSEAQGQVDVDRIFCTGVFEKNERSVRHDNRDIKIIGLDTNTYITSKINNQTGSWTSTDNYYSANIGDFVGIVIDFTNLNSLGVPTNLTSVASISEVNTTLNSFYVDWATTTIYVRTFDDRVPDADVWLLDNAVINSNLDNRKYYFENINFAGNVLIKNNSATGGSKTYMKDCSFMKVQIWGQDESILENCKSLYGLDDDKINYDVDNTVVNNGIEINCDLRNTISGSSSQASTSHNNCNTIRINGNYEDVTGQCIADVTGSNSWNLGCIMEDSTQNVSFYLGAGGNAWLTSCTSKNNTTDIYTETGATVYVSDFDTDGANGGTGTVIVENTEKVYTLEERVLALETI